MSQNPPKKAMAGMKTHWMRIRFFVSNEESLWWAYRFYADRRVRKGDQPWETRATNLTDLVLDGFPGSGNSFLSRVLKKTQGESLKFAHHLHASNQLVRACHLNIPAVLVLRKPVDSICSMHRRFGYPFHLANSLYLKYHRSFLPWQNKIQIVPFEMISENPMVAVKQIEERWKIGLKTEARHSELQDLWAIGKRNRESEDARNAYNNHKKAVFQQWKIAASDHLEEKLDNLYQNLLSQSCLEVLSESEAC